jgi:hypothetical protein
MFDPLDVMKYVVGSYKSVMKNQRNRQFDVNHLQPLKQTNDEKISQSDNPLFYTSVFLRRLYKVPIELMYTKKKRLLS